MPTISQVGVAILMANIQAWLKLPFATILLQHHTVCHTVHTEVNTSDHSPQYK